MTYARQGLPFLMDHDTRTQIGLLEDVKLGRDGRLRAMARAGNHPDAPWVFADIRAGIRPNISVGYRVMEMKLEASDERGDTYRVTRWMPMEGSTVPVPADITVGAGRAASETEQFPVTILDSRKASTEVPMSGTNEQAAPASGAAPGVQVTRDYDAERRQRNDTITNIAKLVQDPAKRGELLTQALQEDWTPTRMAQAAQEANIAAASAATPAGHVDLTPREQQSYSMARAILSLVPGSRVEAGFEREVSQQIAARSGQSAKGLYIPLSLSADRKVAQMMRAAVTGNVVGTTSLGGLGVESSVQDLIEILRNGTILNQLGVRFLSGLTGNILFPRQITANSWTWEGENPATAKALTAATIDSFTMSPKTGFGATAYSKQFLVQSSFSVDQFVREDLAQIAAIGIDAAGINGAGTSNQPTGILNISGVETEVMGSNGLAPAWSNVVSYETKQAQNNAAQGRLAFLTTPGIRGKMKTTLKNTVAGADYLWGSDGRVNGYDAFVSTNVPSNLTKGTSTTICHGIVFGNWQEMLVGTWGDALDLTVDPYYYADQGMVRVIAMAMVDCNVRHPKSFVVTKDALTT